MTHEVIRGAKQALKKVKKGKTNTKKLRSYNVFYVPTPAEHELVVKAPSLEAAVKMVKDLIGGHSEYVRGGWEVKDEK